MSECRTLIVDDEETYARALQRLLGRRGIEADVATTAAEGLHRARRHPYHLVVLDYMLPDGTGLDLIPPLRQLRPTPAVLMMTAYGTIDNAVEAMRRGATDYVPKSTALADVVERVVEAERVARTALKATPAPSATSHSGLAQEFLGESQSIREVRTRIQEVAQSPDTTVLLCGESGTGKGVGARAIHALSARSTEPFVAIDCVALPAPLAESELFGHEKGAFTGAERLKPGRLEVAGRGTVLLDEIGDMEPVLQGKLLRVLEERTFERVGGVRPIQLEARVIAASHRDLSQLVAEKKFRLDLYHRLSVFPIQIPALRDRGHDIVLLAEHFLGEFGDRMGKKLQLHRETSELLLRYDFPGNVRELRNLMERAAILAPSVASGQSLVTPELLPPRVAEITVQRQLVTPQALGPRSDSGLTVTFEPGRDTLENLERRLLEEALRMAGGKKVKAAEILGISRFALLRRVEKYGL
ncbi:MAG TPA: sigma-54 dependent transcriptional regulator [Pseudomonadota bacterium]|jgi:DNA-binding NtrC family response regulator|nr:sigma-54 dependent transcriptional regulator [Pseudomonadota bacterium]HNO69264.1 sigma-54 dependent transcriptional regulator [Pseudomonadota bacterium]